MDYPTNDQKQLSRRDFFAYGSLGVLSLAAGCSSINKFSLRKPTAESLLGPDGQPITYMGNLKFQDPSMLVNSMRQVTDKQPYKKYGTGRNTRQYTDFSELFPDGKLDLPEWDATALANSTRNYYIRTETPNLIDFKKLTHIKMDGLVEAPSSLAISEIVKQTGDIGVTMMECAGNDHYAQFRLMSAADWDGIWLEDLLKPDAAGRSFLGSCRIDPKATHVLINGFDDSTESGWNGPFGVQSTAGASWIFSFDELIKQKAFLATKMNGETLTPDHGFPVRLMVPGYYGCASIKWIDRMTFLVPDERTPATSQMIEFADRTNQHGSPKLYKDHIPPELDLAAMPIKAEKWRGANGQDIYRLIGLVWGGMDITAPELQINFKNRHGKVLQQGAIEMSRRDNLLSWQHWTYWWKPEHRGHHLIDLNALNPGIKTRRLDKLHYQRMLKV